MKLRKSILLSALMLLFLSSCIAMVYATTSWGSLSSGYAVTSNYHGIDVPSGADVVVTAMTTDAKVDHVIFVWKNPVDQIVWMDIESVEPNGTKYDGKLVYYATSAHKPEALGDWGVQAIFVDLDGIYRCILKLFVSRRATSFNVVPEVPIIGTAGASIAMLLGFTYKIKRKPKK
jgi:hypothetical protein